MMKAGVLAKQTRMGLRLFSSSAGVKFTFNRPYKGHKLEVPESSAFATKVKLF